MDAHARGEAGDDAAGEVHGGTEDVVHAALVHVGGRENVIRLFAREHAREVDAVAADVHQSAAAERAIEADVAVDAAGFVTKARADEPQLADLAGPDGIDHRVRQRMRPIHKRLDENELGLLRGIEHLGRLRARQRERLFAKHMLAGAEGFDRPFMMERIREGEVNRLNVGVGEELVVAVVGRGDVARLGKLTGGI